MWLQKNIGWILVVFGMIIFAFLAFVGIDDWLAWGTAGFVLVTLGLILHSVQHFKNMKSRGYVFTGNQWIPGEANPTRTTKVITEDNTGSPLEILQKRLVRGEITGEEYDELKTKMDNTDNTATPMRILQQRLARGEIKLDEFNRLHGRM